MLTDLIETTKNVYFNFVWSSS